MTPTETLTKAIELLKDKYGEDEPPKYMEHYVPARGYPGQCISLKERKEHIEPLAKQYGGRYEETPEYLWYCVNCKKKWSKCFDTRCEQIAKGNIGYKTVLYVIATSKDPSAYIREHLEDK